MARNEPLQAALATLHGLPRASLAATPTPLLPAPRLAARLGTRARLWIKADAWTGLGLGGNKVRKLEYELAPNRLAGVTELVTEGGPQSNHCRVAAAAAARLGLACTLVVDGDRGAPARGNALLHRLLGARIVHVAERAERAAGMAEAAARADAAGGRALVVPAGASTPLGTLGYAHAALEMRQQLDGAPARVFCAASSGGTMAGLALGCALAGWTARLAAVSADESATTLRAKVAGLAADAAALVGGAALHTLLRRVDRAARDMHVTDEFVGPGYGVPTPAGESALAAFARSAGVVLDPVYTAKAAAAMIAALATEAPAPEEHWVFLHTGGHPALFA